MKLGFVFPGQGSQSIEMGKDLYDYYEEYRKLYINAREILGIDVSKLTFESTDEELAQTKNTQICILLMSLGILEILRKHNINSNYLTGLSLGEYSALLYANSFSFEDGIRIVKARGELMQENVPTGDWSMAAILGLEDSKVDEVCKQVNGFVVPANYNCPGQVVLSGEKEAVSLAMVKAKEFGAKRAIELNTSGPFHTVKLQAASDKFKNELQKIAIHVPEKTVVKNIDGCAYTNLDNMAEILSKHIINPVKFNDCIQTMINLGVDTFVEIGPGKVLSGFIKKIDSNVTVLNINNKETLEQTIAFIKNNNEYMKGEPLL